jgi:pimeloyl-ACP methyl ester carboxylesterase
LAKTLSIAAIRSIWSALAVALFVGGLVVAPSVTATAQPSSTTDYLTQKVDWNSCGTDLYCAKVQVPMDWSDLKSQPISLAVIYHRASISKPLGSVIFNPGGPGASGYDFVHDSLTSVGTNKLRQNYNFVGFDPRGVQHSSPAISCYSPAQLDKLLYADTGYPLGSAKDLAASRKSMADFAAACAKKTGPVLGHVDTISAAKDLDVLRAVMGDAKLNYLGYSYGTLLGATYASLFPNKVGKMVLDGAIDPTVSNDDQSIIQLKGFDNAFNDYLADCLKQTNCPFTGTVAQARAKVSSFLKSLETSTIPSTDNNREVNVWGANSGIDMALYSNSYWPVLSQAFTQAFKGDGTLLLRLADLYNDRNSDGTYNSNETEAFMSIGCLDGSSSAKMSDMVAQNKRVPAASSVFGRYWQWGGLACSYWKYKAVKPLTSYAAKGSPTIVVVGTTGDPATPYSQAVSLAHKVLSNGYLVTWKGEGHTAYGRSNSCVNDVIDGFFIDGTLPKSEPTC